MHNQQVGRKKNIYLLSTELNEYIPTEVCKRKMGFIDVDTFVHNLPDKAFEMYLLN